MSLIRMLVERRQAQEPISEDRRKLPTLREADQRMRAAIEDLERTICGKSEAEASWPFPCGCDKDKQ